MQPLPNLCYTIAFDAPGQRVHRNMARLLVTSLIRTGWHGRIVVFRNQPCAVLPEGNSGVEEVFLDIESQPTVIGAATWKFRLRQHLDLKGFGKVLFLDCDCIVLRDINHLMYGGWDIYTAPEPGRITEPPFNGLLNDGEMTSLRESPGLNSGVIGIRAIHFDLVMAEWERIYAIEPKGSALYRDQHSWNRLVLDTKLRHRVFARGEVQFPFLHRAVYHDYRRAALIHAADRTPAEKLALLYGLWVETFAADQLDRITAPEAVQQMEARKGV